MAKTQLPKKVRIVRLSRARDSEGRYSTAQVVSPEQIKDAYGEHPIRRIFAPLFGKKKKVKISKSDAGFVVVKANRQTPPASASSLLSLSAGGKRTTFHFSSSALEGGTVDKDKKIIYGVSVITAGVPAKGHKMDVDDTTLEQIYDSAISKGGQVAVKENHKSGVGETTGYLCNFRVEGNRLRADWHLLTSYPKTEQFLETAEKMPKNVGLSASFVGPERPVIGKDGRQKARCEELLSVDFVSFPAANPNGLFSADSVDIQKSSMADNDQPTEPTLAEILAEIKKTNARIDGIEAAMAGGSGEDDPDASEGDDEGAPEVFQTEDGTLVDAEGNPVIIEDGDPETDDDEEESGEVTGAQLAALASETDVQLSARGLTRADVNGAIIEFNSKNPNAPVVLGGGAGGDVAINRAVTHLESLINGIEDGQRRAAFARQKTEIDNEFSGLEQRITDLNAVIESQKATIELLGNPGARFSAAGFDRRTTDFEEGSFEHLVELSVAEGKTKAQAMQEVIQKHPELHREYRRKLGVTK